MEATSAQSVAKRVLTDMDRCIECGSCAAACYASHRNMPAVSFARSGAALLPVICRQCKAASCVATCPAEAMVRDERGVVRRRLFRCVGCGSCAQACPFGVLPAEPTEKLFLPYLGDALDAGVATLLSLETICAMRCMNGQKADEGFTGFISDTILRELGIQLVDGRMPGFAAILGPAPTDEIAVHTIRELQKRSILSFLIANRDGASMKDQLDQQAVEMGWETYIVPVGRDTHAGTYVLDWAMRGALTFGGHKKGDFASCLKYLV